MESNTWPDGIPSGTINFLFTDIEGSTHLWETRTDQMGHALREHDRLLKETIEGHGGYVFKMVGDAFCAAFTRAEDALLAAIEIQGGIETLSAGTSPLRVRIGLHAGSAEERGGDYFGQAVNRTARLMSAGHGGQILLSASLRELVADGLPAGFHLVDLGERSLKDLTRPEHIYQLSGGGLPTDFPPLKTQDGRPNNLPAQTTSFVGRLAEKAKVLTLLRGARLLTLLGAGGSGKTRLSIELGREVLDTYPEGVWFVDLAPLPQGADAALALVSTLALKGEDGFTPLDILKDCLRRWKALIILDNCEHLVDSCAALASALLGNCPGLSLVATSREALGVPGETTYLIPLLGLPRLDDLRPESLSTYDSVALFIDRARSARSDFKVDEHNAPDIAEICVRIDGMPLAIELAAARVRSFSVCDIRQRLNDRFKLLSAGPRTVLPRQRTLRALIDWSYELLEEEEKAALAAFSVFRCSFSIANAEALAGPDAGDSAVILAEKSLLLAEPRDSGSAFRMLETVRAFAAGKLSESGVENRIREAHLVLYLRAAEDLGFRDARGTDRATLDLGDDILVDALAAADYALSQPGREEAGVTILYGLLGYAELSGHLGELRPLIARARELASRLTMVSARAMLSCAEGKLLDQDEKYREALSAYDSARQGFNMAKLPLAEFWALFARIMVELGSKSGDGLSERIGELELLADSVGLDGPRAAAGFARACYTIYVLDDGDSGLCILQAVSNQAERAGDLVTLWATEYQLARMGIFDGQVQRVKVHCEKVRRSTELFGDPGKLCSYYTLVSGLEHLEGNEEASLLSAREALTLARRHAGSTLLAYQTQEVASRLVVLGRSEEGLALMEDAVAMLRETGADQDTLRWRVFYLAQAYATVERFDEAFHIVDAAVTAARSGAGGDILAQELIRQARIYIAAGRYEHALECTREAAALADPESDTLHALRCPEALSLACLGTGYDAGLARAELVRCTKGRIPVRTSAWLVVHARLAALRGEPREAYRLVASALAHAWIRDYIAVDARMAATSMMREFSARLDAEEQSVLDAEVKENGLFRIARELIEVDEPA